MLSCLGWKACGLALDLICRGDDLGWSIGPRSSCTAQVTVCQRNENHNSHSRSKDHVECVLGSFYHEHFNLPQGFYQKETEKGV